MMILADHYLYFRLSLTSTIRGAPSTWTGGKRWDSSLDLAKNYLVEYWILKFLDRSLNIHLLHILSLRNYVDFIYFAAGRRGANLGYCRSPGGQLRHVPVGAVRHSLRRHQEVPARLLRELLQRGPHQDPADQRGQSALPPRQPSGRRHREFRTVLLINCQPLIVSVPFRLLKLYYFDCSKFVKLFRVQANWGQHLEHWPPPVIMPYDALNTLQRIFFWRLFTLHCIR